jgi:hypothetical protein
MELRDRFAGGDEEMSLEDIFFRVTEGDAAEPVP